MPEANLTKEVAENVRRRRTLLGLSQADLAEKAGLSEFTIYMIEGHKRSYFRPSTMRKLARGLETTVADLYGAEDELGPLAENPLQSPEGRRWSDERADWDLYAPPGAWIKSVADAGLDGLREKAARLFDERARARRELKTLGREIRSEGSRAGFQDRSAWAKELTEALRKDLEGRYRIRLATLETVEDVLIDQERERLPEPEVFAIFEGVNVE